MDIFNLDGGPLAVIVWPNPTWTEQELHTAEAIVRNAVRLLDDAALLSQYERHGTAFTLATLAFEEAGKVALRVWGDQESLRAVDRNWSFHVRKQAAAAVLLQAEIAEVAIKATLAQLGLEWHNDRSEHQQLALREAVAKAIYESKERRLLELVAMGAIERSKQIGLYADDWSVHLGFVAGQFSSADCAAAIDEGRRAVKLLRHRWMLEAAKAMYVIGTVGRSIARAEVSRSRG